MLETFIKMVPKSQVAKHGKEALKILPEFFMMSFAEWDKNYQDQLLDDEFLGYNYCRSKAGVIVFPMVMDQKTYQVKKQLEPFTLKSKLDKVDVQGLVNEFFDKKK
jgi:hypothetical protein